MKSDKIYGTYTTDKTTISIPYGQHELKFIIKVGYASFEREATNEEMEKLRGKMNVMDFKDFEWQNIIALDSLCKHYYIVITEEV